ncbi:MAG: GNAT family N-acetyltransferase [Burkholderiales bacterium]|nr:GNAT family N-acetyltransferase [Burkholderiales bacterium]
MNPVNALIKPVAARYLPIKSLGPQHRERICAHLLALDEGDRYLRFGYPAGDVQIRRYVDNLNLTLDDVFGIFNRKLELVAMAHLAYALSPDCSQCAEFGVSVSSHARGRGYGARLFERATMHARNEGVSLMFIHALSENTAMLNIARKAGARLVREGSETEAFLQLPPANFDTLVSELVQEQVAQTDYHLKRQAHAYWRMLAVMQDIRQGVREVKERAPA